MATTFRKLLNLNNEDQSLANSTLIVVDAQREYLDGNLPLSGIDKALDQISHILYRARSLGTNIIHVQHFSAKGAPLFNPDEKFVDIIDEVKPIGTEPVIKKNLPDSFADTDLDKRIKSSGKNDLVVVGFMTHACISATVRSALNYGYHTTVVANACATRDLPTVQSNDVIAAGTVHDATMAALSDLFARVIADDKALKD
ncbi:MAG: cysteine hydrolase [Candidatus Melainabacteria bacterium]|jgi:nicotinamidase-related amidase|nr:cysteine hydrolase [Candidatus Melainabacteria bacterium]